jgi:hypothetical protein
VLLVVLPVLGEAKVLSKGMIVELEKQVHLQKVVGAGDC